MKTGLITPQGTDSFKADTWQKVYEDTLASAQTSITISDLDGNTDVMYRLVTRHVCGALDGYLGLRPNNDTGTNYGFQQLYGANTTIGASRNVGTYIYMGDPGTIDYLAMDDMLIYAKSGYIRTFISTSIRDITGTTVTLIRNFGQVWNNTADNITSFTFFSGATNGLGVGTYISLFKPLAKV